MADIETLGILDEIQALVSDKLQVVSYKWLIRNFLVPSNTAKRLLEDFVEKNGSQLEVMYSLSGWLKTDPSAYHIQLVSSSKLSEAKEEFGDNCSVQVYSVQACIPKDPAVLWNAEFIQAEELFQEPPNVVNCLRDNRFCEVSNSFVKRNTERTGTPIFKTSSFQEKKVEQSNPKPDKGKDAPNGSHKAQVVQEVKAVPQKEKVVPQFPNKKKIQNDKTSSGTTSGSLASMWGRASSKPKPESAPIKADPIPVSNDAQVLANESMENISSDDDEDKQMNFKRGSNGEGNNRKRRVFFDNSDEDDDLEKDVVSLASPDPPKKQVSVDSKKSLKKNSGIENKNLDFDEPKEEVKKEKVSEIDVKSVLKEESKEKKMGKPVLNENICREKDEVEVEQKDKGSDAAKNVIKKRKVLKTRIDERGREVTEVVWEDEEKEKETKPDDSTRKDKPDNNTNTNTNTTNRPLAAAPKKSPAVGNTTGKTGNKKAGSKDPKQGNIMSFFKKK